MSKYVAKAAMRQAKNFTKGYTDIQVKVREATSNDPWGPSGSQMAELADDSFNMQYFQEIMAMLDKRLNDSGKNWRHVFKALTVLDYLIHAGSEQVVAYAKQNLYVIKTLKEFQYVDEEGKDQGVNVREKSKAIAALLADEERLKDERRQRQALRDRMASGSVAAQYGSEIHAKSSYQPHGSEDQQLQRAIEESKRSAEEHERKMREKEREDRELQKALELSKQQQQQQAQANSSFGAAASSSSGGAFGQQQQSQGVDLWGASDQKKHDLDFFSSMAAPTAAANSQPDPFGIEPPMQQQQQMNNSNLFAAPTQQFNAFGSGNAGQQNAFGGFGGAPSSGFQQQQPSNSANQGGFASFDSAFDNGSAQKNFIPRHLQGQNNPAAQLAQIARNASQIDPFAHLASTSSTGAPKPPTNNNLQKTNSFGDLMSGGSMAPVTSVSSAAVPHTQNPWASGAPAGYSGMSTSLTPTPASAPPTSSNNGNNFGTSSNAFGATGFSSGARPSGAGSDPFAALDPFGGAATKTAVATAPKLAPPMNVSASGQMQKFSNPAPMNAMGGGFGGGNMGGGFNNNAGMGFGGNNNGMMMGNPSSNPYGAQSTPAFGSGFGGPAGMNMGGGFGGMQQQQQQPFASPQPPRYPQQPQQQQPNFFF